MLSWDLCVQNFLEAEMKVIFIPALRFFVISKDGLALKFPKYESGIKYDVQDIFFQQKRF